MSYSLSYKGTTIGVIKGNTSSLDYSTYDRKWIMAE